MITLVAGGLLIALSAWLFLPFVATRRFKFDTDRDRAEIEDNYRKTVGQAIGAVAVIATFAWTFFKDSDAMQQAHDQFRAQIKQFKEQQDQAKRQFANQQFIAAATLLKENSVGARVAGIYGLNQVVADEDTYRSSAIHAALGFIKNPNSDRPSYSKDLGWPPIQADTESAITLLAMLDTDHKIKMNLDGAYLVRADFSVQQPTDAFAQSSFQGAILYGSSFSGTNLTDAKFNGAYMTDWEAYGDRWTGLSQDDYENTRSEYVMNFSESRLINAGFDNANIGGGIFDKSCLAGAKFWLSDLSRASFKNASLGQTASCEPTGNKAHFFQATLTDADFGGVDVAGVSFEEAKLIRTHFEKALNVDKAKFGGACGDNTGFPPTLQISLPKCGDK